MAKTVPPIKCSLLFCIGVAFLVSVCDGVSVRDLATQKLYVDAQTLVAHVNQRQTSWKAKIHSRFAEMTLDEKKQLMGVRRPMPPAKKEPKSVVGGTNENSNNSIPEQFDAREHFKECVDVIATIQDQSACGSCWAVSAASVISDRICIASGGKQRVNVSALDLLSCEPTSYGCHGGFEDAAFRHYVKTGLCTGSRYELQKGCKPYPWAGVPHPSHEPLHQTPKCAHRCQDTNYLLTYTKDKHYGKNAVQLDDGDVAKIQTEIMRAGPVTAAFQVFEDFMHYAGGVYQHVSGQGVGGHAVRMVGWGVDAGTKLPYWLIANSWNYDWGQDGYFKIRRGTDECGIERWGINFADPDESV